MSTWASQTIPALTSPSQADIDGLFDAVVANMLAGGHSIHKIVSAEAFTAGNIPNGGLGKEAIIKLAGTANYAAGGYVGIYVWNASDTYGLGFWGCTGVKEASILKTSVAAAPTWKMTVQTTAPHGFNDGEAVVIEPTDFYAYPGTKDHPVFGWGAPSANYIPTITVTAPDEFTVPTQYLYGYASESHTGKVYAVLNPVGHRYGSMSEGSQTPQLALPTPNAQDIELWQSTDAFRTAFGIRQHDGSTFRTRLRFLGQVGRDHVRYDDSLVALLANPVVAVPATPVTVTLDRAATPLTIGQSVDIISSESNTFERATITGLPGGSDVELVLVNDYPAGSIFGIDPSPILACGYRKKALNDPTLTSFFFATPFHLDGSYVVNDYADSIPLAEALPDVMTTVTPDSMGIYQAFNVMLRFTNYGPRRTLCGNLAIAVGVGSQSFGDIHRTRGTLASPTGQSGDYMAFVDDLVLSDGTTYLIACIGPGADSSGTILKTARRLRVSDTNVR